MNLFLIGLKMGNVQLIYAKYPSVPLTFSWPKSCRNKDSDLKIHLENKNAFQSKAHLLLADRKSNTYNLTLEWPWLWCNLDLIYDLDLRQVKLN